MVEVEEVIKCDFCDGEPAPRRLVVDGAVEIRLCERHFDQTVEMLFDRMMVPVAWRLAKG